MRDEADANGLDVGVGPVPDRPLTHAEAVARSRRLRENLERQLRDRRN